MIAETIKMLVNVLHGNQKSFNCVPCTIDLLKLSNGKV